MQRIKIVLKLLLLLLAVYLILRVVFEWTYFGGESFSFSQHLRLYFWGLRMDFAALFYLNLPFLVFYFFIAPFLSLGWQTRVSNILFSVLNLAFIALNFIDLVYFKFTLRRSTIDIFYILDDSLHSFGSLFRQYWWILLIFILFCIGFVFITKKIFRQYKKPVKETKYIQWLAPLLFIGLSFLVARGWEKRPLVPSTALLHADPSAQPLVNNSSFNLLYSWLRFTSPLERRNYFSDTGLDSIYTIKRQYPQQQEFEKRNIVIFMLESFNESFFTPGPDRSKTPFFDSLFTKSTVCTNAFANGHESVKGIMAILGSIPPFLDEPLFTSNYSSVPFKGIGTILKDEGYNTNFFLGAEYDHFNFAKLCRMTGIDHYYSKDSYGHADEDDGNWGIYDQYFFSYFADVLSKKQQPFFSVLFNISSHPPFAIPYSEKNKYSNPGQTPQQNSITYVDDCFRQLFERIKTQPWFSNSLFVFCSDHTLVQNLHNKSYQYKAFHIPLFIYDPRQPVGDTISAVVQQLDIIPSVLDRLHYAKSFVSFGNSFFRSENNAKGFSIYKANENYQLTDSTTITGYDSHSEKIIYHYNYRTDSLLSSNLAGSGDPKIDEKKKLIRAILQRFSNSLVDHKLLIE